MPVGNIKTYIIDASFCLAYLLPDEDAEVVNKIFEEYAQGKIVFISSPLLPYEIINSLREATRKRVKEDQALALAIEFLDIDIIYQTIDFKELLKLSIKNHLSAYDASYLYLAKKEDAELLTLDTKLKNLA